jgi:hypothetical protein
MKRESPGLFSPGAPGAFAHIRQQAVRRGVGGWGAIRMFVVRNEHRPLLAPMSAPRPWSVIWLP